jgi:hypothetical protein
MFPSVAFTRFFKGWALILADAIETTVIRHNRFRCDRGWDIDLVNGNVFTRNAGDADTHLCCPQNTVGNTNLESRPDQEPRNARHHPVEYPIIFLALYILRNKL